MDKNNEIKDLNRTKKLEEMRSLVKKRIDKDNLSEWNRIKRYRGFEDKSNEEKIELLESHLKKTTSLITILLSNRLNMPIDFYQVGCNTYSHLRDVVETICFIEDDLKEYSNLSNKDIDFNITSSSEVDIVMKDHKDTKDEDTTLLIKLDTISKTYYTFVIDEITDEIEKVLAANGFALSSVISRELKNVSLLNSTFFDEKLKGINELSRDSQIDYLKDLTRSQFTGEIKFLKRLLEALKSGFLDNLSNDEFSLFFYKYLSVGNMIWKEINELNALDSDIS